jgi:predicted RNA-binding protein with PIN domain
VRTLIDGYNLLYAFPPLRKLMIARQSAQAREGLVKLVAGLIKGGSLKAPATIVFDGKAKGATAAAADAEGLDVRFAPHPDTADSLIGDIVEGSDGQDHFTVVSSDREVQSRVRSLGAKVVRIKDFVAKVVPERKPRPPTAAEKEEAERDPAKPYGGLPDFMVDEWLEEFGLGE